MRTVVTGAQVKEFEFAYLSTLLTILAVFIFLNYLIWRGDYLYAFNVRRFVFFPFGLTKSPSLLLVV